MSLKRIVCSCIALLWLGFTFILIMMYNYGEISIEKLLAMIIITGFGALFIGKKLGCR